MTALLRVLDGKRWFGGRGLSRKDVSTVGVLCLLGGALVFILSLFVASKEVATALRVVGLLELGCAGLVRLNIHVADRYQLWPGAVGATPAQLRSWRTRLAEYTWMFGTGALSIALVLWLVS